MSVWSDWKNRPIETEEDYEEYRRDVQNAYAEEEYEERYEE